MRKTFIFLLFAAELSAAPVRIMPLGDSITAGYTDNSAWTVPFEFGYRRGLCILLGNAGIDFQFVGGSPEPFDKKYGDPTLAGTVYPTVELREPDINQGAHRGYGGINLTTLNANVASYIAADNPDVILLMAGINGIGTGSPSQLNTLVGSIFAAKPGVRLIVAQIPPRIPYNANVVALNTHIRNTLVPNYANQGRSISTVNQYANFLTNPADDTSIDTSKFSNAINHPTNPAYGLMAATWLPAITPIALNTSTFPADIQAGETIATLSRLAPSPPETFSFSLVSGSGDSDNAKFRIEDNRLLPHNHHFEVDPLGTRYGIRVSATGNTTGSVTSQALVLTLAPAAAPAALIQTFSSNTQSMYSADVKNNDLLHGVAGTHINFRTASGASGPRINDGLHGADTIQAGIAWASDGNFTSSTFNLGPGNGAGYDVTKITSIAAWNGAGFMNQKFKTSVRYSGATRFTSAPDCNVVFQPFSDALAAPGATKVIITRPGSLLFSGIEEIRFTLLDTISANNGGVTLREIDVEGALSAVPATRILDIDTSMIDEQGVIITWQSRPAATYRIESSGGLSGWGILDPVFPSAGYSTRYVDALATASPLRNFYRIRINP